MARAQSKIEFRIEAGAGPSLALPDALERTALSFFGPTIGDSFVQISIDDLFDGSSQTRRTSGASYAITVRASQTLWETQNLSYGWDTALAFGAADYTLPFGAGPFKDPISVDFSHITLTPRLYVTWDNRAFQSDTWGIRGGIGSEVMHVHTAITSALLDIRQDETFNTAFLFSEVFYKYDKAHSPAIVFGTQLGANDTVAYSLSAGVSF